MSSGGVVLAGMQLAISTTAENDPLTLVEFQGLTYTQLTGFIDIGAHGEEANIIRQPLASGVVDKGKGSQALSDFPVTAKNSDTDAGLSAFESAAELGNNNCYAVRYTAPNGKITYYRGPIAGFQETGGNADANDNVTFTVAPVQQEKA